MSSSPCKFHSVLQLTPSFTTCLFHEGIRASDVGSGAGEGLEMASLRAGDGGLHSLAPPVTALLKVRAPGKAASLRPWEPAAAAEAPAVPRFGPWL